MYIFFWHLHAKEQFKKGKEHAQYLFHLFLSKFS